MRARRGRSRLIFTGGSWLKSRARLAIFVASSPIAFEVLGNFHRHGDEAQVGGQRRLGEQLDDQFVDLHLELVDDPVIFLYAHGEVVVALEERLQGLIHRGLGVAGHGEQFLPQTVQPDLKMFSINHLSSSSTCRNYDRGMDQTQPNRPVT